MLEVAGEGIAGIGVHLLPAATFADITQQN